MWRTSGTRCNELRSNAARLQRGAARGGAQPRCHVHCGARCNTQHVAAARCNARLVATGDIMVVCLFSAAADDSLSEDDKRILIHWLYRQRELRPETPKP